MELNNLSIATARSSAATYENQIKKTATLTVAAEKASGQTDAPKETIIKAGEDQVQINSSPISTTTVETVKSLEGLQKKSNELAQNIRATNKNIGQVTDLVSQMQSSLSSITKNFPPFNIESKDRQQILMSYISIRKELIKMSVPPPVSPIYEQVASNWERVIGKSGAIAPDAAPVLQAKSSDSEVALAEISVNNTKDNLAGITSAINEFRSAS